MSTQGYHMASPHLILWGVVWLIGYGAMAAGVTWPYLWLVLSLSGSAASFAIGYAMSRGGAKQMDWRWGATFLAIFLFISALFAIMPPQNDAQYGGVLPDPRRALLRARRNLDVRGLRMIVLGALLAMFTLIVFFHAREHFLFWMAGVGGGGLILGGLWLRTP